MTSTPLRAPHRLFAARGPHRPAGVWPVDAGIEDVLLEPLVFPGIFTTTVTSTRRRHKTIRAGIKLPTPGINRASLSQACHLRIGPGHLRLRLAPAPGQGPPGPASPRRRSRELLAIPQEPQKDQAQPSQYIGTPPENGEQEGRLLLRFAAPRDPQLVADWVSFNVIDTECQDWARGWAALKRYTEREGHARLPMGHKEGA